MQLSRSAHCDTPVRVAETAASRRKEHSAGTLAGLSQPPRFQTELRVSKYDLALRDERGAFTGDAWTSVSDVGDIFGGEVLTLHRYLEVESHHLQVVATFLAEAETDHTMVRDPERYEARCWPVDGKRLTRLESVDLVREMLRERGFCRLEAHRDVYIHVGHDYYVYMGGNVSSEQTRLAAAQVGLFVDPQFVSPYHLNPSTGGYF